MVTDAQDAFAVRHDDDVDLGIGAIPQQRGNGVA